MADSQRKTANLFSIDMAHDDYSTLVYHYTISGLTPNNQYTCSSNFVQSGSSASIWFGGTSTGTNGVSDGNPKTMTSNANGEIDFYINHNTGNAYSQVVNGTAWIMVNEGSTPLPYEPYWQHSLRKLGTSTDTITTLPADVYADGNNAIVGLVGNMNQSGTPSPTTPIQPSECSERTGNLWDEDYTGISNTITYKPLYVGNGDYTLSSSIPNGEGGVKNLFILAGNVSSGASSASNGVALNFSKTVTAIDGYVTIAFRLRADGAPYSPANYDTMLNTGSTALPYEPYGYKIPISSANTTTNVYLGEEQSTRKIKKLVLTGEESWNKSSSYQGSFYARIIDNDGAGANPNAYAAICSHAIKSDRIDAQTYVYGKFAFDGGANPYNLNLFIGEASWSKDDFKAYLAAQYANGTPVCVWYVLAEPTTGIVNEPIRKIGDYADTVSGISVPTITGADSFDVLTTLKPSEVELTYTGWHDASVKEWDGSEWQ